MEEENIDLHAYLQVLLRRWKWAVGIAAVVLLFGGLLSLTTKPVYEATAQFTSTLPSSPVAQLAVFKGNRVAAQALKDMGNTTVDSTSTSLARQVSITVDPQDKTLYQVAVQANTPQRAAEIANAWMNACVQEGASKFLRTVSDMKSRQSELARLRLEQADRSLVSYLQVNGLTWDQVLFSQIPISNTARAIFWGSNQLDNPSFVQNVEVSRLVLEREAFARVYTTLAAEAEQSRIAFETADDQIRVLTVASEPSTPIRPNLVQNLMIAATIGLVAGLFGAFLADYFGRTGQSA